MICHDAITPDGRTLHFDELLATGDLVYDRGDEQRYIVGLDRGDELPLLHPVGDAEYLAWWNEQQRKRDERYAELFAPSHDGTEAA